MCMRVAALCAALIRIFVLTAEAVKAMDNKANVTKADRLAMVNSLVFYSSSFRDSPTKSVPPSICTAPLIISPREALPLIKYKYTVLVVQVRTIVLLVFAK